MSKSPTTFAELRGLFDLTGQVAIVTGSGTGLGTAIARSLTAHGARVVICGRTESEIETAAKDIRSEGGDAMAVRFDATDRTSCEALVVKTIAEYGRLDIAVINHGIGFARESRSEHADRGEVKRLSLATRLPVRFPLLRFGLRLRGLARRVRLTVEQGRFRWRGRRVRWSRVQVAVRTRG